MANFGQASSLTGGGGQDEERSILDNILGRGISSPLGQALDGNFDSLSLNTDKITTPTLDDLFNKDRMRNSPAGLFLPAAKKSLIRGGKEIVRSGEKLAGDVKEGVGAIGPSIFNSLASGLNDAKLRNIQGDLAVTDVATAPFSKGSLVDSFGMGAGGADVNADIREAILLDENRRRRDEQEELRDSLFGLTSERMKLQNAALKRAEKEALANKSKR